MGTITSRTIVAVAGAFMLTTLTGPATAQESNSKSARVRVTLPRDLTNPTRYLERTNVRERARDRVRIRIKTPDTRQQRERRRRIRDAFRHPRQPDDHYRRDRRRDDDRRYRRERDRRRHYGYDDHRRHPRRYGHSGKRHRDRRIYRRGYHRGYRHGYRHGRFHRYAGHFHGHSFFGGFGFHRGHWHFVISVGFPVVVHRTHQHHHYHGWWDGNRSSLRTWDYAIRQTAAYSYDLTGVQCVALTFRTREGQEHEVRVDPRTYDVRDPGDLYAELWAELEERGRLEVQDLDGVLYVFPAGVLQEIEAGPCAGGVTY